MVKAAPRHPESGQMTTNQKRQQGEAGRFYGASGAGFPLWARVISACHTL